MIETYQGLLGFAKHLCAGIDALARRRGASIVMVFFLSTGGSWLFSAFRGIPVPQIHDEFSYLLAGDTFAHGRLTNPTHPMWKYFETFNILQKPSYMSIYPPGQGIFLAIGEATLGHPIFGVWLSVGLMSAAICWMLYAWLPPRWALVGGLVAVLQFGVFTYWSQSYWGGAVAALGEALVFGAVPRIAKQQCLRDVLWLGLGIGILANSRPLEGFLVGIPLGCIILPWKSQWRVLDQQRFLKIVVLPLMLLVLGIVLLTGAYNKRITGDALMFPHVLYEKQYSTIPLLIVQPRYPSVEYRHKILADSFRDWNFRYYNYKRTWRGFIHDMSRDILSLSMFYFGFPLAIPVLFVIPLLFYHRDKTLRFILAVGIILLMLSLLITYAKAHYAAPLTCMAVLLITSGLRVLSLLKLRHIKIGTALVTVLIGLQFTLNLCFNYKPPAVVSLGMVKQISTGRTLKGVYSRQELIDMLTKLGGRHLVLVGFLNSDSRWDWVFNGADIDNSPIVWARNMGGQNNIKFLEYYKDRQVWEVQVVWNYRWPYINESRS